MKEFFEGVVLVWLFCILATMLTAASIVTLRWIWLAATLDGICK